MRNADRRTQTRAIKLSAVVLGEIARSSALAGATLATEAVVSSGAAFGVRE